MVASRGARAAANSPVRHQFAGPRSTPLVRGQRRGGVARRPHRLIIPPEIHQCVLFLSNAARCLHMPRLEQLLKISLVMAMLVVLIVGTLILEIV